MQGTCNCFCHKWKGLKGILVVLIGLTFLLSTLGIVTMAAANIIWPILLIMIGVKMMARMCKCCDKAGK